jgi:hypothetical protein
MIPGPRYAFGVEFQQVILKGSADQPNEVARDQSAILQDHDLRPLRLVIDYDADPREVGHGTGHTARVLGLFGISRLLRLAEDPAVNLPGLVRLRGRGADTCHQPSGQEDRRENVGQGVGATYVRDGHVGILYGSAGRDGGTSGQSQYGAKSGTGFQVLTADSAPNFSTLLAGTPVSSHNAVRAPRLIHNQPVILPGPDRLMPSAPRFIRAQAERVYCAWRLLMNR